jgi:pimeloyl-ACP methyl ester carboxylesterase
MSLAALKTKSADGTDIGYVEVGTGPAVVVVHGGNQAHTHYLPLARALAGRGFRVVVPDRRGRGLTPGGRPDDGIDAECADLAAVTDATGARLAFGHSAGGLVVAEAAVRDPSRFDAVALFEPALDLVGRLSFDWFPSYERALEQQHYGRAFAIVMRGLELAPPVPAWFLSAVAAVLVRTGARDLPQLMHTLPRDLAMARALTGRTELYRAIAVRSLTVTGARSPRYLRDVAALVGGSHEEIAGEDHTMPVGPHAARLASTIGDFFGH